MMSVCLPMTTRSWQGPLEENKPITVAELILMLQQIQDNSTPVYLESGEPVHYTTFGMNQNETRFFIGVM